MNNLDPNLAYHSYNVKERNEEITAPVFPMYSYGDRPPRKKS